MTELRKALETEWRRSAVLMIGDIEFMKAEDVEPKEPIEPAFYNFVDYVRQTVSAWKDGGVLPRAGGFEDQDRWLMADCLTWISGQNYWLYQAQQAHRAWSEEERARNNGS